MRTPAGGWRRRWHDIHSPTHVHWYCEEADEHHSKDDHGHQYREELMVEEQAPAPLLLHLLSVLCRAILHSFCLSGEQLIYQYHSIMYVHQVCQEFHLCCVETTLLYLFFFKKMNRQESCLLYIELMRKKSTHLDLSRCVINHRIVGLIVLEV